MTRIAVSSAVKYIASKVKMPEGVELFVDDGQAASLIEAIGEDGNVRDWWLVRFVKPAEKKVCHWVVNPDVKPAELFDTFMYMLDSGEWRDWPE